MPENAEPDTLIERATEYVQAHGEGEVAEVTVALTEARALVTGHCGTSLGRVPGEVRDRAIIEVTAELFNRKNSRNGVMDLGNSDLQPFRIRNDPMKAAYPFLNPYLPGGFA